MKEMQMTNEATTTYQIPDCNFGDLEKQINRMQRKVAKLDSAPISIEVTGEEIKTERPHESHGFTACDCTEVMRRYITVDVTATPIKLAGWTFLARQSREDGMIILMVSPTAEGQVPTEFRTTPATRCDHCNKAITTRKDTFLVKHEDGTIKQVGRRCLRDFLGEDPQRVIRMLELIHTLSGDLDEGTRGGFGSGEAYAIDIVSFIAQSLAESRKHGWTSRTNARDNGGRATANIAWDKFTSRIQVNLDGSPLFAEVLEEDLSEATKAVEWATKLSDTNDYEHNISSIAILGRVTYKTAGYAGSIPAAMHRTEDREERIQVEADKSAKSEHVGEIGDREELTLTIKSEQFIEGQFSTVTLYKFTDADDNAFAWFSSGMALDEKDVGDTVNVKGTIKAHNVYRGNNETQLSRVKLAKE